MPIRDWNTAGTATEIGKITDWSTSGTQTAIGKVTDWNTSGIQSLIWQSTPDFLFRDGNQAIDVTGGWLFTEPTISHVSYWAPWDGGSVQQTASTMGFSTAGFPKTYNGAGMTTIGLVDFSSINYITLVFQYTTPLRIGDVGSLYAGVTLTTQRTGTLNTNTGIVVKRQLDLKNYSPNTVYWVPLDFRSYVGSYYVVCNSFTDYYYNNSLVVYRLDCS